MQIADCGFWMSDMFDASICNPQSKIRNYAIITPFTLAKR
jgi:hypothetical protein